MNPYQYVVINEYGGPLAWTVADTADECASKFDGELEDGACCIVRFEPVVVRGRPHGYWYKPPIRKPPHE
jgi:hypothetical protein